MSRHNNGFYTLQYRVKAWDDEGLDSEVRLVESEGSAIMVRNDLQAHYANVVMARVVVSTLNLSALGIEQLRKVASLLRIDGAWVTKRAELVELISTHPNFVPPS